MLKTNVTIKIEKKDISTKKLIRIASDINKMYVKSGILPEQASKVINNKGFTQGQNAYIQEYGASQVVEKPRRFQNRFGEWFYLKAGTVLTIPARVFIRIFTVSNQFQKYLHFELKSLVDKLFKQKLEPNEFYKKIGEYASETQKSMIREGNVKPHNSEMTVKFKGKNKPLEDTGELADDIKYKVVRK